MFISVTYRFYVIIFGVFVFSSSYCTTALLSLRKCLYFVQKKMLILWSVVFKLINKKIMFRNIKTKSLKEAIVAFRLDLQS